MIEYIGALGAGILLIGFGLLEFNKLSRKNSTYHLLNFIGSSLLFGYAYWIGSYVFMALNLMWALVAVYEIQKVSK